MAFKFFFFSSIVLFVYSEYLKLAAVGTEQLSKAIIHFHSHFHSGSFTCCFFFSPSVLLRFIDAKTIENHVENKQKKNQKQIATMNEMVWKRDAFNDANESDWRAAKVIQMWIIDAQMWICNMYSHIVQVHGAIEAALLALVSLIFICGRCIHFDVFCAAICVLHTCCARRRLRKKCDKTNQTDGFKAISFLESIM